MNKKHEITDKIKNISEIDTEIEKIINKIGHFPTCREIKKENKKLLFKIYKMGKSICYFREKLGYELYMKPPGYWTKEKITKELKEFYEKTKKFPILELLNVSLQNAIQRSGKGIVYFRKKIGLEEKNKPHCYWNNFENVKKTILPYIENNKFPSYTILKKIIPDAFAVIKKHGGRKKVAQKLKCEINLTWSRIKITKELKIIIYELKRCPTLEEIKHKNKKLFLEIKKAKNLSYFKEKLGYKTQKPANYWTDKQIIKDLKKFYNEINELPTQTALKNKEKHDLIAAIGNSGKSIFYFRKKLGLKEKNKPPYYWHNFENLANEIKPYIKNNQFPYYQELINNVSGIGCGLLKFGGIVNVAKKMGYDPSGFHIASDGHHVFSVYELILDEYLYSRKIPHEINGYIHKDRKFRYDFKVYDYFIEIWGYPPNKKDKRSINYNLKRKEKEEFYKNKNLKLISLEHHVFHKKTEEEIINELDNIFLSLGFGEFKVDVLPIIKNVIKHNCFLTEKNIIQELELLIIKLGEFPSINCLRKLRRFSLIGAIQKYGGILKFRKIMNYELKIKEVYYWNDKTIIEELKKITEKIQHFPFLPELRKMGKNNLVCAINRNGKINKFRKILGESEIEIKIGRPSLKQNIK